MDLERQQIDVFLEKCDDVMRSKFIIADTKISELLKSIATSDLLYAFFREITKDFDYAAAQRKYMNYAPEGSVNKRKLLFPADPAEKLAFIFCLLVDFDNKTFDLGEFLQEYFYEDGSYYESFYAFSNQVVKPFKNLIKQMFKESRLKKIAEAEPKDRPPHKKKRGCHRRGAFRAGTVISFGSAGQFESGRHDDLERPRDRFAKGRKGFLRASGGLSVFYRVYGFYERVHGYAVGGI